jgi:hypothetical protein
MNRRIHFAAGAALLIAAVIFPAHISAQQQTPIGSVSASDADVSTPLDVVGGKTLLRANTTITAHDHTAEVSLERHGLVLVCATTALHVADSQNANGPLMLSIDRGALELRILAHPSDVLLTPDLRIQSTHDASLDLQVRVARNGDTCIENRSANPNAPDAPTLEVHEQFGDAMYLLRPGQHVLFNYGSLRQVVDNETEPCGCPATPDSLIADAGTKSASQTDAANSSGKYPFPLAQSEGLAPTPSPAPLKQGETQVTLATTMQIDGNHPPPQIPPMETTPPAAAPPTTPPQKIGFFHSIGHFFGKLFGGK